MNKPELYQNNNSLTQKDLVAVFELYLEKIKWRGSGDRIVDIGCADGGLINVYKRYLPNNYRKIVGCDISPIMVEYANKIHGDDKTMFRLLDIVGDIPADMVEGFDHLFAFYVLHWIVDQRSAFQNFYKLLAAGGDCLLSCFSYMPFFDCYRIMSRKPKWSQYMTDVEKFVSPYQDTKDPVNKFENYMKEAGFKETEVRCLNRTFVFDNIQQMRNLLTSVNPFEIPNDLFSEYMDDFVKTSIENNFIQMVPTEKGDLERPRLTYNMIAAYGCK